MKITFLLLSLVANTVAAVLTAIYAAEYVHFNFVFHI